MTLKEQIVVNMIDAKQPTTIREKSSTGHPYWDGVRICKKVDGAPFKRMKQPINACKEVK